MPAAATTSSKVPAVLTGILAVQKGIDSIPKNGVGPASKGSFAFMQFDDIVTVVHRLLNEHEVLVRPEFDITHSVDRSTSRAQITAVINATYTFISAKDGSEFVVRSVGEGSDIGSDTATRKAASQALKVALLQMFTIPTGEYDPEAEEPKEVPQEQPKVAQARRSGPAPAASPVDEMGALRQKVQTLAGRLGYASGEINKIAEDNGLTNAFHDNTQINQLIDILESLVSEAK